MRIILNPPPGRLCWIRLATEFQGNRPAALALGFFASSRTRLLTAVRTGMIQTTPQRCDRISTGKMREWGEVKHCIDYLELILGGIAYNDSRYSQLSKVQRLHLWSTIARPAFRLAVDSYTILRGAPEVEMRIFGHRLGWQQ